MTDYPFSITKRSDSPFYYVCFKNEKTGKLLPRKSTGQITKDKAIKVAMEWLINGTPAKEEKKETIEQLEVKDIIKKGITTLSNSDIEILLNQLKKQGSIRSFVITNSKQDITFTDYLLKFWDYENSEYIHEKMRRKQRIGKGHCLTRLGQVKRYWIPFFNNKILGDITKQDIKDFVNSLENYDIAFKTKNQIIQAGTTPLRYAYDNELIEKDITRGLVLYSGEEKERNILTPEIVQALFSIQWTDDRAKLANLLSMVTGLRAGEIQALKFKDLGENCLYINHSWSREEGLKCPKNGEKRVVYLPFPQIIEELKQLAATNPFEQGLEGFVFYASIPNKPIDAKTWLESLRVSLQQIGLSEETSKAYTFHSWRHFFATYMKDKVNDKVLQAQTGHKTLSMLEHYASHKTQDDVEKLCTAQVETFTNFLPKQEINFDTKKLTHCISKDLKENFNIC